MSWILLKPSQEWHSRAEAPCLAVSLLTLRSQRAPLCSLLQTHPMLPVLPVFKLWTLWRPFRSSHQILWCNAAICWPEPTVTPAARTVVFSFVFVEVRSFLNTIHKNKLKMYWRSKCETGHYYILRGKHRQNNLWHKLQQYPFWFISKNNGNKDNNNNKIGST